MTTYFTSDLHLGHENVIKFCNRPYSDVWQMDKHIERDWNIQVRRKDTVYILGDFSFHTWEETLDIISRLNGKKIFIRGNHDYRWYDKLVGFQTQHNFELAGDYKELNLDGHKLVLTHYPFETWNRSHYGSIHLHGHCHGGLSLHPTRGVKNRYDVGWDVYRKLVTIEDILDETP